MVVEEAKKRIGLLKIVQCTRWNRIGEIKRTCIVQFDKDQDGEDDGCDCGDGQHAADDQFDWVATGLG